MYRFLRISGFILSLICMALIVYLSFSSIYDIPEYIGGDKGGHFLAYMALSAVLFLSFASYGGRGLLPRNLLPLASAFSISFVFSYAIELCQPYFSRHFDIADLVAGSIGAVCGCIISFLFVLLVCTIERRRVNR